MSAVENFRSEVRSWLATVPRPPGLRDYGATPAPDDVVAGRAWQRLLAGARWACLAWPPAHGGRGASIAEQAVFAEECARAGVPRQLGIVGPDLVGPMLLAFGTPEQKERWLADIRTGEALWCQLFSEPDAGSDLAALGTRARRRGAGWIVDGAKLWSSGANSADLGLLLARTGDGRFDLSMFVVPMRNPGLTVRPLRQMDGESKFNEVAFDGVRLGDDALVGSVGDGWKLAQSVLGSERLTLGAQAVALRSHLEELFGDPGVDHPVQRDRAVALWVRLILLRVQFERLLASGRPLADPAFSVLKLAATEAQRDLCGFAVALLGPAALAGEELQPPTARLLAQPGQTIAGGTSEIQRTILGERVLGLPR
jgi:alkylation response protein AidB-like acyl-CoA dehydrogenase